jgi:hypothetical protein
MSIRFTPEELLQIQGRLQQRFMARNFRGYLRDPRFIVGLATASLTHPSMIAGGVAEAVRCRRLSSFARAVFGAYKLRHQRRATWMEPPRVPAPAAGGD